MTLKELVEESHNMAKEKGWWDQPRSDLECHMLMVSEVAEATEDCRKGKPSFYLEDSGKPNGEAVELVDTIIRIADYFGHKEWDLEAIMTAKLKYNKTRPYRHGNKKY